MDMAMRPAEEADAAALGRLMGILAGREVGEAEMRDRVALCAKSPIEELYVCEVEGQVAAALGFRIRENVEEASRFGEVSAIVVDPARQGQGIGGFLIDFADALARARGCIGLWLVSGFGAEEAAHAFYKGLGFSVNGLRFVRKFKREVK